MTSQAMNDVYTSSLGGTVNPNYEISVDGDVDDVTGFDSSQSAGSYQVEGFDLGKQQFKALFLKRFHYARFFFILISFINIQF